MYNKLSFQDQLSQKYLNQQLLQIQRRKPLYTEEKEKVKRKKTLPCVTDDIEIQLQNRKLVQKLIQVKYNPAYVKKMYMREDLHPIKKHKSTHLKASRVRSRNFSTLKQRQICEQNKRIKKTLELIKSQKRSLVLPLL